MRVDSGNGAFFVHLFKILFWRVDFCPVFLTEDECAIVHLGPWFDIEIVQDSVRLSERKRGPWIRIGWVSRKSLNSIQNTRLDLMSFHLDFVFFLGKYRDGKVAWWNNFYVMRFWLIPILNFIRLSWNIYLMVSLILFLISKVSKEPFICPPNLKIPLGTRAT